MTRILPPQGFADWLDYAVATFDARSVYLQELLTGGNLTTEEIREAAQNELTDLRLRCASSSRGVLARWARKLSQKLGRPEAHISENGLLDSDFGYGVVRIRFEDGSSLEFNQAFLMGDPKQDGAIHAVAVFTSNNGYHQFWIGPNDRVEVKPRADRITSWTAVFDKDPETGDVILPLDDAFLKQEDWRMNDRIRFDDVKQGSMNLVNVSKEEREKSIGGAE
ncbi:hypothetical protein [Rhodoferax bucti]|uniref:hypothetical protein n=1 Tax=Rhodoferax bucti TaxID=2576305 RepID=UPI001108A90E|nr:hypothetical protein [Rhodoferax bucti]